MKVQDWIGRVLRTLLQIVAGGGGYLVINAVIDLIPDRYDPLATGISVLIVATAQNICEEMGWIPKLFKPESPPAPANVPVVQAPN